MQDTIELAGILSAIYFLLLLVLASRISHWSYLAQHKADETNRLLRKMAGEPEPVREQAANDAGI